MSKSRDGGKWSADVTEHSDALDLAPGIFKSRDPKRIAQSLKHFGRAQHAPQVEPVPLSDVDAGLLHQSRR